MYSVDSLLQCIRDKKELELHIHDTEETILIMPFSCYDFHLSIFSNYCEYFINFSAKKYNVCHVSSYEKYFPYTKTENQKKEEKKQAILEYENDFKNRIKAGNGLITDVSKVEVNCCIKAITWDDISSVRIDECEEKIQNEYGEEVSYNCFRFSTRQDVFKNEFYGDNSYKLFQIFYKDKNENPYILSGYIDYINIQEGIMGLDSYIQVFLKDYSVIEDKTTLIKQACNLKKEDIEELKKTLLTNDCILQPLTQSTTATISTGGFMDNSICTAYDTNLYIQSQDVTIGDKKFKTIDLANALDKIVNNDKIASSTTSKENKIMFNKMFSKYKFGKLDTKDIAYSMNGIAFRTSDGSYVVYNKDLTFTNVDNLVMDIPVFVMPVALSEIKPGDVIVHYGVGSTAFVIVDSINDTDIFISDPRTRERKNLIPEKSIFGFDFVAKVMTPNTMFAADQSNPFGSMLPFMLMGEDANIDNLGFMMLFGQCSGETSWANQYLPLMLMDKGDNDMFKYMMLMQMMQKPVDVKE